MQAPFLIGERIYLRPLEREDAPLLRQWINDPEVIRTLDVHRPRNLPAEELFIEQWAKSETAVSLGIALPADDRLIGTVWLHSIDARHRRAVFGIYVGDKQEWRKGYGTEAMRLMTRHAFETLNLNRVMLQVHEFNPGAIRLYEKLGFRREGTLRRAHFSSGRYWDSHVMAILREEWDAFAVGERECG